MPPPRANLVAALLCALLAANIARAAIAQFDVNDFTGPSPTESGWTGLSGGADNADTLSGTDGIHTLVLSTTGDGQDRNRTSGLPASNVGLWRDFWFVANSSVGGVVANASISGLDANTSYAVEIWGFDKASTGLRSVVWTDAVTGNSGASSFDGSTAPLPSSLADYVATVVAQSNASGVINLTGAAAPGGATGLPNIFVNGLRVSLPGASDSLPVVEAEAGTLGAEFVISTLAGATAISNSPTNSGSTPGSAARVASYSVTFPAADVYQLYARVHVGPASFNDDSFFYATGFGVKSPTTGSDWVAVLSGLANTGFTAAADEVTVGGGSAGTQVWKWVKFSTFFTVSPGALTQTFQIGGREDGFSIDKLAFGPADVPLTVADLDAGTIPERPPTAIFEGPDGVALHRFDEPYQDTNHEGAHPAAGLVLQDGALWGSTMDGGLQGRGTVFHVSLDGAAFDIGHTLGGTGPAHPRGGLSASSGVLYGTSQTGGANGTGAVFKRQADGALVILRSFDALAPHTATNAGGALPTGPLTLSGSTLYGATAAGGANGQGVLFSIGVNGTGFAVLHDFTAPSPLTGRNVDGAQPCGALLVSGGKLYGVASAGGDGGAGVVFSVELGGSNYAVLHAFAPLDASNSANLDGAFPSGGLVLSGSKLHGVALAGGTGGQGALFSLDLDGTGFSVLHDFAPSPSATGANADGARPVARLTASGDLLYGVASAGGAGGAGTVFALDLADPALRVLHHFEPLASDGTNDRGAHPVAELLRVNNTLYGTAFSGGPGGTGVVLAVPIPLSATLEATRNPLGGADLALRGLGAPFSSYTVQATNDLASPASWQAVLTGAADARGRLDYTELNQTAPRRFFRLVENP